MTDASGSSPATAVKSRTMARWAVLVLAALLAIDAGWCCDDTILMQPSSATTTLRGGKAACGDEGGQVDCHACICSGLALAETVALHAPPLQSIALETSATGHAVSVAPSIDIPPDKCA
ncbi:MAG TPA: hypothetical protein VFV51_07755 [Vicinamibacterales bacterium]|nr:hypothetical protein [Vicinamibacterales bacterium]